jgi:hypothetical protein
MDRAVGTDDGYIHVAVYVFETVPLGKYGREGFTEILIAFRVDGFFRQVVDADFVGFAGAHGPLMANHLGRSFLAGLNRRFVQVPSFPRVATICIIASGGRRHRDEDRQLRNRFVRSRIGGTAAFDVSYTLFYRSCFALRSFDSTRIERISQSLRGSFFCKG